MGRWGSDSLFVVENISHFINKKFVFRNFIWCKKTKHENNVSYESTINQCLPDLIYVQFPWLRVDILISNTTPCLTSRQRRECSRLLKIKINRKFACTPGSCNVSGLVFRPITKPNRLFSRQKNWRESVTSRDRTADQGWREDCCDIFADFLKFAGRFVFSHHTTVQQHVWGTSGPRFSSQEGSWIH